MVRVLLRAGVAAGALVSAGAGALVTSAVFDYTGTDALIVDGEGSATYLFRHSVRLKVTLTLRQWGFRVLELLTGSPVSRS